jgi:predicted amidohydrolase
VGYDNNVNSYSGESSLINPLGETLYIRSHSEDIYSTTLTKLEIEKIRKQLPFLNDRDKFNIE